VINNPDISRAFYGELNGEPRSFIFSAKKPFNLYVNLLVPKNTNPSGRYSARVYFITETGRIKLADIKAASVEWKEFYEAFGGDSYIKGPEFKQSATAGPYEIEVYSADNRGKYVLAVGEKEFFGPKEIYNVYTELPKLKALFFGEHPLSFYISPFGIVLLIIVAGILFLYFLAGYYFLIRR